MSTIVDMAKKAAAQVARVTFKVSPWAGVVNVKFNNGHFENVFVLPVAVYKSINQISWKLTYNLKLHSIHTDDGDFVPVKNIKNWLDQHTKLTSQLDGIRDYIILNMGVWEDSIKSQVRPRAVEIWKNNNPSDNFAPPAYILQVANAASLAIPKKQNIIESFTVSPRYSSHPFSYMSSGVLDSVLTNEDLAETAWYTVNELICSPCLELVQRFEMEIEKRKKKDRMDRKVNRICESVLHFLLTHLIDDALMTEHIGEIYNTLNGEGACSVNWDDIFLKMLNVTPKIKKLSTVRDLMEDCSNVEK